MKEITLKAVIESIPQATSFVDEQLEAIECPMKAQMQLDVAIDATLTARERAKRSFALITILRRGG